MGAHEMGFLSAWPSLESRGPDPWPSALGHSIHSDGAQRLSGRLRGLSLYLSRILRPLWLAPVVVVTWQPREVDPSRLKRRRDEWWPPPREPPPAVEGSQWRCSWSRDQRGYVQQQLVQLLAVLERCQAELSIDGGYVPRAGTSSQQLPAETSLFAGLSILVATSVEALQFLELVAVRASALATAPMSAQTVARFSELTFRDLVCQPEARRVLRELMCAGVVACRQLHSRCPRLFNAAELEVQEAFELLDTVQRGFLAARGAGGGTAGIDHVRLTHLVQRALQAFERHAAREPEWFLVDVSQRLKN